MTLDLLNDSVTLTVPDNVMARAVGDELVILHLDSGRYFGLDGVGTVVWERFLGGATLGEVSRMLAAEYDIDVETATVDVKALVAQLADQGLVKVSPHS